MPDASMPGSGAAGNAARSVEREAAPWIETFARFGYAAKGAVYLLVGGLAIAAALGAGGQATGSSGALASIAGSIAGRIALGAIALGLVGYVIWQLVHAIVDPEDDGAARRVFYVISAAIYGGLAWQAGSLAYYGAPGGGAGGASGSGAASGGGAMAGGAGGAAGAGGGGGAAGWSARLMQHSWGLWVLGIVGVIVAAYGVEQIWNAWRVDLDDQLALGAMSRRARKWTIRFSRLGVAARGVVLGIIGAYFVLAAIQSDPAEAKGLGGVLEMLQGTPWLLGIIALGLVGYGLYNLVRARYRVIRAT